MPRATGFRALTGRGVEADVDGTPYAVGGPALLRERAPRRARRRSSATVAEWQARGAAVLYLVRGDDVVAAFALEDEVRPEAARGRRATCAASGIDVAMITGDARQVADAVAAELGIDEVFAEVLPEDKDQAVIELQHRGHRVAMVGDGVNDAPALARADVGLAIGAGTDVAIESAGVILASSDPRGVAGVVRLSRASYRKMVAEPGLGRRLQRRRHPARRRRAGLGRHHAVAGRRRRPDEPLDDRRRPQRPAAPPGPAGPHARSSAMTSSIAPQSHRSTVGQRQASTAAIMRRARASWSIWASIVAICRSAIARVVVAPAASGRRRPRRCRRCSARRRGRSG